MILPILLMLPIIPSTTKTITTATTRTYTVENFIVFNADIMTVDHLNDNDHNNSIIIIITPNQ